MTLCHYKKGHVLFREGEPSHFIYRLVTGHAQVIRQIPGGTEALGAIKSGEFLGEIGVLIACRRAGTAVFTEDSQVERFSRVEFLALLAKDRDLGARLLHVLSLRTRAQIELLKELPDRETVEKLRRRRPGIWLSHLFHELFVPVNEFLRRRVKSVPFEKASRELRSRSDFPVKKFPKGSSIFEEGQDGANVYWVQSGSIQIIKNIRGKPLRVAKVSRNEFVGEMSVLESTARNATAIAVSDVVVREISDADFFQLLISSSSTYLVVIDSLCERVRRLRRVIGDIYSTIHPGGSDRDNIFEAARSVESVAQLAEQRLLVEALKMRKFFNVQLEHGKFIAQVYQKYMRGDAKKEEMEKANLYFRDYLKMAGLSTLFILPGAPLSIPLAVKIGKALGVDILPGVSDAEESTVATDPTHPTSREVG